MRSISRTTFIDVAVMMAVVLVNPLSPLTPYRPFKAPSITDKVLISYRQPALTADSVERSLRQTEAQLTEIRYYMKSHNVADEGYNQVARYETALEERKAMLTRMSARPRDRRRVVVSRDTIAAKDRPLTAVSMPYGHWRAGRFRRGPLTGAAITRDAQGRVVSVVYRAGRVVSGVRTDSAGTYRGQMDQQLRACGEGTLTAKDGTYYEGYWAGDRPHGFGFQSSPYRPVRIGEWRDGRFLGERMRYTADRIYGIDISRHQHEKGRRRYAIRWADVRITSLGARHDAEGRTFPVSFAYIKSTEGTTIRNRYFLSDYMNAKRQGIRVGAYHFFSLKSSATAQANYFVSHTLFRQGDFPPVLDVEPTDAQIRRIGGDEELMRRIRTFMETVEQRTGMRPILYVSQGFINKHMDGAADLKQKYNVWIARYGQYRPDVRLVYWQLCPDGKVEGITGPVDINVFNGFKMQFDEFAETGYYSNHP